MRPAQEEPDDVSARTVLAWVHKFGPLLAAEGRRHAAAPGVPKRDRTARRGAS